MSSHELAPYFPSATHPALPLAVQLLSTLRSLTGPGRGNDLRAEARAALVGVAALIACERVQSNDLVERTAQKAASVSPAHFRAALAVARRVLAAADDTSPRRASTRARASPARAGAAAADPGPSSASAPSAAADSDEPAAQPDALSPFQTPRKKFKYSSGIDLSGLSRSAHKHSPAKPSPLRPRLASLAAAAAADAPEAGNGGADADAGAGVDMDDVERTPTKRRGPATPLSARTDRRRRGTDGAEAFFALRPGAAGATPVRDAVGTGEADTAADEDDEDGAGRVDEVDPDPQADLAPEPPMRDRCDWTYREAPWAADRAGLERILAGIAPTPTERTLPAVLLAAYD